MGLLVFRNGKFVGEDVAGVSYDGTYSVENGHGVLELTKTVPPGVSLVQGLGARSTEYKIATQVRVPIDAMNTGEAVTLEMPPGPVSIIFNRLRSLDE
jgi:hypothetical protein